MKQPRRGAGLCHLSWVWMLFRVQWGAGCWVQQGRAWLQAPSHHPSQGQPIPGHWALPGDGAEAKSWGQQCGQLGSDAAAELLGHTLLARGLTWCHMAGIRTLRKGHRTFQIGKDG